MSNRTIRRSRSTRAIVASVTALGSGMAVAGLIGCYSLCWESLPDVNVTSLFVSLPNLESSLNGNHEFRGYFAGINVPSTLSKTEANIPDDSEVIGVCADGKTRAYVVAAMAFGPKGPSNHVVNDLIGRRPVTVTYCDISHCSRVFTNEEMGTPLNVGVGGLCEDGMLLAFDGGVFSQRTKQECDAGSGAFPLAEWPYERTSWKSWREAHPDTDVYIGELLDQ
jgi:hypothetical protein